MRITQCASRVNGVQYASVYFVHRSSAGCWLMAEVTCGISESCSILTDPSGNFKIRVLLFETYVIVSLPQHPWLPVRLVGKHMHIVFTYYFHGLIWWYWVFIFFNKLCALSLQLSRFVSKELLEFLLFTRGSFWPHVYLVFCHVLWWRQKLIVFCVWILTILSRFGCVLTIKI